MDELENGLLEKVLLEKDALEKKERINEKKWGNESPPKNEKKWGD